MDERTRVRALVEGVMSSCCNAWLYGCSYPDNAFGKPTHLIDEAETEMQPRRSKISRKKGTLKLAASVAPKNEMPGSRQCLALPCWQHALRLERASSTRYVGTTSAAAAA